MGRKACVKLSMCTSGILLVGLVRPGLAQLAVSGNLGTTAVNYGSNVPGTGALATQTINTSFGDNLVSTGATGGSELDAAYGVVQSGYLYMFFAGNIQNNGNPLDVFIDDGRPNGQNTLNAGTSAGAMHFENGSVFSPGFNVTYALEINTTETSNNDTTDGTLFVDQFNLVSSNPTTNGTFLGQFRLTGGVGTNTEAGSSESAVLVGVNNTNTAGVTGSSTGTAANATAAQAVTTGIEIGIPLSTLGDPTGNIEVMAGINGNGDSGFCNQFLPGLQVGTPSIKKGPNSATNPYYLTNTEFTFANTPNEFFTVPNTVIANGIWLPTGGGTWDGTTTTNWSNGVIPNGAGVSTTFSSATVTSTVTLAISPTVGIINFSDSASSYLIAADPGQSLTLDNGGSTATANINDNSGIHFISAPVVLNSNALVICQNHGDVMNISGNISGAGGLIVSNPGIFSSTFSALVLSGTNTYQGATTILRGELQLASANALPVGTALTIDDPNPHGVLDLNGFDATVGSLAATTGGSLPAQITNSSSTLGTNSTFTYAGSIANPSTFPGIITDSSATNGGNLSLAVTSGALTLAPTGTNTYTGTTTVNTGATLALSGTGGSSLFTGNEIHNDGSLIINDTVSAGNVSGAGTTTVNASMSLQALNMNQAGGLVNNGTVTVLGSGTVGPISGAGTLNVSGSLQLATSSGLSQMASLNISGSGTFDVNNNHVIINYGSGPDPISSIAQLLLNGYNEGSWNGTDGITSSAAAANNDVAGNLQYGLGYADSADSGNPANLASGTIEIKYTLLGDADLSGVVDGTDFGIVAANFNKGVTGWDQGDFNYDNVVDGTDFGDLAANFNKGASGAAAWQALVTFAAANGLMADVPEPASIGIVAVAGLGLSRRRRARRYTSGE